VKKVAALLILTSALTSSALADPSPQIRRLMNEPVSMLDWGLDRMGQDLNQGMKDRLEHLGVTAASDDLPPMITVSYNYSRNLIEVELDIPFSATFKSTAKEMCHRVVNKLRDDLGSNSHLKPPVWPWVEHFVPNGYTSNKQQDEALHEALPKLVSLKSIVYDKDLKKATCTGMLTEEAVSFKE
jgi:hypothetical protein